MREGLIGMLGLVRSVGLAAPAGLNAFLPLLIVGIVARSTPLLVLNPPYDLLTSDWLIVLLAALLMIEIVADKVAGLDSLNDTLQTAARPAAGAFLFAASEDASGGLHPLAALLVGLALAAAVHAAKMLLRPRVTLATRGVGNPLISLGEDALAMCSVVLALLAPQLVPVVILIGVGAGVWLLRRTRLLT